MLCVSLLRLVRSFTKTSPLRNSCRLLACESPPRLDSVTADSLLDVVAVLSSRLSPAFAGSDLLTTTGSSATSHHLGHCLIDSCNAVSSFSRFAFGRTNAAWMMPGFPSYCASSLSVDHVSSHLLQLFLYRASRLFARSLLQPAESSSLTLRSL